MRFTSATSLIVGSACAVLSGCSSSLVQPTSAYSMPIPEPVANMVFIGPRTVPAPEPTAAPVDSSKTAVAAASPRQALDSTHETARTSVAALPAGTRSTAGPLTPVVRDGVVYLDGDEPTPTPGVWR